MFTSQLVVLVALAAVCSSKLIGQSGAHERTIPDKLECVKCRIEVSHRVALRETTGRPPLIWTLPIAVREDDRGRFWVLQPNDPVLVYAANGWHQATIGRRGKAFGEYGAPVEIIPIDSDSVAIVDALNLRTTVVDAGLVARRFIATPWVMKPVLVQHWPQSLVAHSTVRTPESVGWPLHRFDLNSDKQQVLSSFGPDSGTLLPGASPAPQTLAHGKGLNFWAADLNRYRLVEWSAQGKVLRTMVRNPAWFRGAQRGGLGNPSSPPPPKLADISSDSSGLLWCVVNTPRATWKEAWPAKSGNDREVKTGDIRVDRLFLSTVEAIEPRTGRVVARLHLAEYAFGFVRNHKLLVYRTGDSGERSLEVLALTLRRP